MAEKTKFPCPKVLLYGDSGVGKTHAIKTFLDAGVTPFVIFTEQGMDTLADVNSKDWHWTYLSPKPTGFAAQIDIANTINKMGYKTLCEMAGANKRDHNQFVSLLELCSNFVDQHGEEFGPIDEWGEDKAIIIDGLGGVSAMAMALQIGNKPTASPSDYGIAMSRIEEFVLTFCNSVKCHGVIIAHPEREYNEATGTVNLMAGTLGKKLAPKLGRHFNEIVYAYRDGKKFYWSNLQEDAVTKTRNLPLSDRLEPSFGVLVQAWRERVQKGEIVAPEQGKEE